MKTREINMWVNKEDMEQMFEEHKKYERDEDQDIIVTITFAIPERKIEITESDLDKVLGEIESKQGMDMFYRIKEKLFTE